MAIERRGNGHETNTSGPASLFAHSAHETARLTGKPITFLICVAVVLIWAASGPYFHYSDTWQLVINTSTTIVTFLMVFLIQNTQNRDALAIQIKLSELIIAMKGAPNRIALIDDLSDKELEKLQQECHEHAECHHDHAELVKSVLEGVAEKINKKAKPELQAQALPHLRYATGIQRGSAEKVSRLFF
jgi:low affinity Fe/Cu permease